MDTSSNMAYGMTVFNRDTALDSSADHEYEVVRNHRVQGAPPTPPRQEQAAEEGESGYEVGTPSNIRQMRMQQSSQMKEGPQEGEEEKELYSQIP